MNRAGAGWARPAGLLLDMDGTLVDTEPLWFEAAGEAVARFGGHLPEHAEAALVGLDTAGYVAALHAHVDPGVAPDALHGAVLAALSDRLRTARACPGAVELVAAALEHGVRCAVVSNSSAQVVRDTLAPHAFAARLSTRLSADDVPRPKPAPDLYAAALERIGVDAARCVAVEDSPTGARAAVAAGLRCIGVAPDPERTTALHGVASVVVGSLVEVARLLDLHPPRPRADGEP